MSAKSNLALFDAIGKLDDVIIEARRPANEIQHALLEAQLECVEALVARGITAKAAIALVVLASAFDSEVSS